MRKIKEISKTQLIKILSYDAIISKKKAEDFILTFEDEILEVFARQEKVRFLFGTFCGSETSFGLPPFNKDSIKLSLKGYPYFFPSMEATYCEVANSRGNPSGQYYQRLIFEVINLKVKPTFLPKADFYKRLQNQLKWTPLEIKSVCNIFEKEILLIMSAEEYVEFKFGFFGGWRLPTKKVPPIPSFDFKGKIRPELIGYPFFEPSIIAKTCLIDGTEEVFKPQIHQMSREYRILNKYTQKKLLEHNHLTEEEKKIVCSPDFNKFDFEKIMEAIEVRVMEGIPTMGSQHYLPNLSEELKEYVEKKKGKYRLRDIEYVESKHFSIPGNQELKNKYDLEHGFKTEKEIEKLEWDFIPRDKPEKFKDPEIAEQRKKYLKEEKTVQRKEIRKLLRGD